MLAGVAGLVVLNHSTRIARAMDFSPNAPIICNMRIVLDTGALVSALHSDQGASRRLLTAALERRLTLLLSLPLMLEYEAVLTEKLAWEPCETSSFLDDLASVADPVELSFIWRPHLKDPAGETVLETAIFGRADLLVTHNFEEFAPLQAEFRITVARPGVALHALAMGERKTRRMTS